jgi:hypothetical protein
VTANRLVAPGATPRPRKRPTKAQLRRRQQRNRSIMTVLLSGALLVGLGTVGGYGLGRGVDWVRAVWPDPPAQLLAQKAAPPEALDPAGVAEACTPEAVTLDLVADGATFTQGDSVDFTLRVTNDGRVPCLVDSTASSMHVVVTGPDDEQVWSSADCAGGGGEDAMLAPGWSWEVGARWSGITSKSGCDGKPAKVDAGTYTASMALADVPGAQGDPVDLTVDAPPEPEPKPDPSGSPAASGDPEKAEENADAQAGDEKTGGEKAGDEKTGGENADAQAADAAEEPEAG